MTADAKIDLSPVDAFHDDVLNDGYRSCDFCHKTACDDIRAGLGRDQWRKFYHATDGSGLDVCEHCVGKFQGEKNGLG